MRDRIVVVKAQRALVMVDGIVERTRLEQHVSDVHDRRNVAGLRLERGDERFQRGCAVAVLDERDAALVMRERAVRIGCGSFERGGEIRQRFFDAAPFERGDAGREGRARRGMPSESAESGEEWHDPMLRLDVVTLFPAMFAPVIGLSIVGRAIERGLVDLRVHDLLDALEPGERADDRPFGGGPGMVLRVEPLARALDALLTQAPTTERRRLILTSASGREFAQADAQAWSELDRLVLICGHYEGVDERLAALYPIEEVSLGEFVLTGGEIPAMAFLDATVRLVEGAIAADSREAESYVNGGLDHPAFTRPPSFRGVDVPAVLLSGDHAKIAAWRREASRARAIARKTLPPKTAGED